MITVNGDMQEISIQEEELCRSIGIMQDMHSFLMSQPTHSEEVEKAVNTAVETMMAFWCEHFSEDDDENQSE